MAAHAAGVVNAVKQATELIWIFDQYFWSLAFSRWANKQLKARPNLCMIVILPPHADDAQSGNMQHHARHLALSALVEGVSNRGNRIGIFDLWDKATRHRGIYVHAKSHTYDGELLMCGSANVNRRCRSFSSMLVWRESLRTF